MVRSISLQSELGGQLRFKRLRARDTLGKPFHYEVEAVCSEGSADLAALLGTPMSLLLNMDGRERHFSGLIASIEQQSGVVVDDLVNVHLVFTLVPRIWLLEKRFDCRINVDISVPELARKYLSEIGCSDVQLRLSGKYPVREYCVQYNESSQDFLSRLFEQEGIYYYFEHARGKHTLVLADGIGSHSRHAPFEVMQWQSESAASGQHVASVSGWRQRLNLHPVRFQLDDYDPLTPRTRLLADESLSGDGLHGVGGLGVYQWQGGHGLPSDNQRYAQVLAEARNVERASFQGKTVAWGLAVGQLFKLDNAPQKDWNQEYLVTAAETLIEEGDAAGGGLTVSCRFQALPGKLPFRTAVKTSRPYIAGMQSAVVAGERDEDIAVDKHGRVQVDFHWSNASREHAQVSCPIRVATAWAGKGWGMQVIPRVGQEVLVAFLDGDPDRPLIVGSVYNGDHAPPYALPDQRTRSGLRSRSHPDGGADDFNEICFEDRKGSEDFLMHAQKDMHVEVENDHCILVEHDRQLEVRNDHRYTIDNDETGQVKHDRQIAVDNEDSLQVGANATTVVKRKFKLDAGTEIELVTGASSLVMKSSGEITLKGVKIVVEGSQSVAVEGKVQVNVKAGATMDIGAGASLKMHSDAMLQVQAGAQGEVKAPMLSLSADALAKMSAPMIMIG